MPESIGSVVAYFGSEGAGAAALTAEDIAVAGTSVVGTGSAAGGATAGVAGTAVANTGGSTLLATLGKAAATTALTAGANSLLAPKAPGLPPVTPMPDPQAQEAARKQALIEQMSRRGRASTVLTDDAAKLGG